MYVAYCIEHLRDGQEEGAKLCSTIEKALEWINKCRNGFAGSNCSFKLFHLGEEISLEEKETLIQQPVKKTFEIKVK